MHSAWRWQIIDDGVMAGVRIELVDNFGVKPLSSGASRISPEETSKETSKIEQHELLKAAALSEGDLA
ncbi:hypothetical protein LTR66_001778 [Elasticomyces elasticus]|nr:hypothetical protein LTR66_001778 [Elasticomyces elasticus]